MLSSFAKSSAKNRPTEYVVAKGIAITVVSYNQTVVPALWSLDVSKRAVLLR